MVGPAGAQGVPGQSPLTVLETLISFICLCVCVFLCEYECVKQTEHWCSMSKLVCELS